MREEGKTIAKNQLEKQCVIAYRTAKSKDPNWDDDKFKNWYASLNLGQKEFPSRYFMVAFHNALAERKFHTDPEKRPPTIEMEISSEQKDSEQLALLEKALAKEIGFKPRKPAMPKAMRLSHIKNPLYRENTYASVQQEAKQENTSMHEICRRKGLDYCLLVY